jgi:hypothetical protein
MELRRTARRKTARRSAFTMHFTSQQWSTGQGRFDDVRGGLGVKPGAQADLDTGCGEIVRLNELFEDGAGWVSFRDWRDSATSRESSIDEAEEADQITQYALRAVTAYDLMVPEHTV